MKLRIKFTGTGPLKFLGHLDIMRYFQKAIRRSGIDISYTTGFSPHQIMSFAYPLGVGMESEGEYFDIEADSVTSSDEMCEALNREMADGFTICDIKMLPDKAVNAMASVSAASYKIFYKEEGCSFDFSKALSKWNEAESVMYEKDGKKGPVLRDIKPYVFSLETSSDKSGILLTCDASSANNVKPFAVFKPLLEFIDVPFNEWEWQILRLDLFTRDSEDKLISLNDVGEKF